MFADFGGFSISQEILLQRILLVENYFLATCETLRNLLQPSKRFSCIPHHYLPESLKFANLCEKFMKRFSGAKRRETCLLVDIACCLLSLFERILMPKD